MSLVNSVPEEVIYCAIARCVGLYIYKIIIVQTFMFSLFSSPVIWKKSRQQGVWSLITQEESAQLETAMITNEKSVTIADEIVSYIISDAFNLHRALVFVIFMHTLPIASTVLHD